MSKEIVSKIRDVEAQAEKIKREAGEEAKRRVQQAELESKQRFNKEVQKIEMLNAQRIEATKNKSSELMQSVKDDATAAANKMREEAEFNLREAIRFIISGSSLGRLITTNIVRLGDGRADDKTVRSVDIAYSLRRKLNGNPFGIKAFAVHVGKATSCRNVAVLILGVPKIFHSVIKSSQTPVVARIPIGHALPLIIVFHDFRLRGRNQIKSAFIDHRAVRRGQ